MEKAKTNTGFKKTALWIVMSAAVLLIILILLKGGRGTDGVSDLNGRQAFLSSFGWEIDPASEDVRSIQLPEELSGTLLKYNELQLEQGYDLSAHLGENCRQYCYRVLNYPDPKQTVLVTLYIQGDSVIAGDVHSTALNGFIQGLKKE